MSDYGSITVLRYNLGTWKLLALFRNKQTRKKKKAKLKKKKKQM